MPLNLEFEFSYPFGPVIDLRLRSPNSSASTLSSALVDTGADISLFDESVAESLGIDLTGLGEVVIRGVGGSLTVARLITIEPLLLDEPDLSVTGNIAFARIRGLGTGNLIGLDILDHFDFGLSHRDRLGYLGRTVESN